MYRAASITDESHILGFIGSLHHFTRLRSLAIDVRLVTGVFDPWESIGALISTGSLNSGLKLLSIHFEWSPRQHIINIPSLLSGGLEFALGKAEVLDPLLENSFKQLATLSLGILYIWSPRLRHQGSRLRAYFSWPAVEDVLRKKLPKISQKGRLKVSVYHLQR